MAGSQSRSGAGRRKVVRRAPPSSTQSSKDPTPSKGAKRLDAYSLRSRILGKAAGVFGKRGTADIAVEEILEAAGVSRRTFYRFFESKEDVLDALHEIGCNRLIGAAQQIALQPGNPQEKLKQALEAYVNYHVTVGTSVMFVVQGESMRAGSKLGPRRQAFLDTMAELWNAGLTRATGLDVDPLLIRSLLVAIEGVSLSLRTQTQGDAEELERAKRVMMRIVFAAIAAPPDENVPPLPTRRAP